MSRPPLAREKVLDAFEQVLLDDGERAATMDRVAAVAGVSKGGLLYHFASKVALEEGLCERLDKLVLEDLEELDSAAEGTVRSFIRTSNESGGVLDRAMTAVGRLASTGSAPAHDALIRVRTQWREALRPYVDSEVGLDLIMLISDGIYFNNTLAIGASVPEIASIDALIDIVIEATGAKTPEVSPPTRVG